MKRGIYRTDYNSEAYVSGPRAKFAYDLVMGERIPLTMVTHHFVRKAVAEDVPASYEMESA